MEAKQLNFGKIISTRNTNNEDIRVDDSPTRIPTRRKTSGLKSSVASIPEYKLKKVS